ncbi:MAG TPA: hypothetical protein PKC43_05035 [Phycisphaerales bacterium]|nr:hypothetical protein [Phycisphaerales bacterium]HMP36794.1 hypothetical protein [Phycisphaerales bacterium]
MSGSSLSRLAREAAPGSLRRAPARRSAPLARSCALLLSAAACAPALPPPGPAGRSESPGQALARPTAPAPRFEFREVARFEAWRNASADAPAAAEIVAANEDGTLLAYTDPRSRRIGFVDLRDPRAPLPLGAVEVAGEPTSVAIRGARALAVVDAGRDPEAPAGALLVIDLATRRIERTIDLGGQPDSIAVAPDGRFAAIAIENQRDEKRPGPPMPQLPGGFLVIVDLVGEPSAWRLRRVELAGIAELWPQDPEPEFVAISARGIAAVTLQENNHIVLVDLAQGTVVGAFSAGFVDLEGVEVDEAGLERRGAPRRIGARRAAPREPDGIAWVGAEALVTANEGDLDGGTRGFTLFDLEGRVLHDSGDELERLALRRRVYPFARAERRGVEPEGVAFAEFSLPWGAEPLLFVAAERGNFVSVHRLPAAPQVEAAEGASRAGPARGAPLARPEFLQLIPVGPAPEGLLPIPSRGLLVVASELDDAAAGVRSAIAILELTVIPEEPGERGAGGADERAVPPRAQEASAPGTLPDAPATPTGAEGGRGRQGGAR